MEVYIGIFIVLNCLALTIVLAAISVWLLLRSGNRMRTKRVDEPATTQSVDEEEIRNLKEATDVIEEEIQGLPTTAITEGEDVLPKLKGAESIKQYPPPRQKRNVRKHHRTGRSFSSRSMKPLELNPSDPDAPRRCPHGVSKLEICAICEPERYKFWYGDD